MIAFPKSPPLIQRAGFFVPAIHGESMQNPAASIQRVGEEVYSAEDVCSFAKISYDSFQRYRREERGPPEIAIGKSVRYLKSDVVEWLKAQRGAAE